MPRSYNEFIEKFNLDSNTIHRNEHWTWSVRPVPTTVGAGILSLNRPAERFGEVTRHEATSLASIVEVIEHTLTLVFEPDKLNYLMLMMVDLHVHFHVIPRYARTITFHDLDWTDHGWPALPNLSDYPDRRTSEILGAVRSALLSSLP